MLWLTVLTVCKALYGIVKAQPQLHAKMFVENMQRILRGKWFFFLALIAASAWCHIYRLPMTMGRRGQRLVLHLQIENMLEAQAKAGEAMLPAK